MIQEFVDPSRLLPGGSNDDLNREKAELAESSKKMAEALENIFKQNRDDQVGNPGVRAILNHDPFDRQLGRNLKAAMANPDPFGGRGQ